MGVHVASLDHWILTFEFERVDRPLFVGQSKSKENLGAENRHKGIRLLAELVTVMYYGLQSRFPTKIPNNCNTR